MAADAIAEPGCCRDVPWDVEDPPLKMYCEFQGVANPTVPPDSECGHCPDCEELNTVFTLYQEKCEAGCLRWTLTTEESDCNEQGEIPCIPSSIVLDISFESGIVQYDVDGPTTGTNFRGTMSFSTWKAGGFATAMTLARVQSGGGGCCNWRSASCRVWGPPGTEEGPA